MKSFLSRHEAHVTGVLSGFDRLVFRGTLRPLMRDSAMYFFLEAAGILSRDFKKYVLATSNKVKRAALAEAERAKRPTRYIESTSTSKEDLARQLLHEHPIEAGLICVLSAVEPCMSFEYQMSPNPQARGYRLRRRKCLHLYKYFLHPVFGFMNARIQTWFPFNVQVCMNGRAWLARQLERRRSSFKQVDNCFTSIANIKLAQRLMNEQLETDWPRALTEIARSLNPVHEEIFEHTPMDYYWSTHQSEWATDVMFRNPRALADLYPRLVRHAMHHFQSPDVMRFLAGKAPHGSFTGQIATRFKDRPEGVRVKHWLRGNSIKMYDKAGSLLRVETTINENSDFKVLRPRNDDPDAKPEWLPLRKGVADLHRRAQLSQRSNETYLDALAVVEDDVPCSQIFDDASRPVSYRGRRVRALRLGDPDEIALLQAVARGEFATAGFRNRDIRGLLNPSARALSPKEERRLSARMSRRLRLLRAHGLIKRISGTHRYRLSTRGGLLTAALFAARAASIKTLLANAA